MAEHKGLCGVDPYLAPKKIHESSFFCVACAASEVSSIEEKRLKIQGILKKKYAEFLTVKVRHPPRKTGTIK